MSEPASTDSERNKIAPAKHWSSKNNRHNDVERGKFLLELYQKALLLSEKELYDYFLDNAVSLTGSTIGFFHFVSDDQKSINLTAWNGEALKNCVANYSTHYPIELAGNWVDCLRLRHPVIYNDFPKSPNQKGFPAGHVLVKRFMSIPVFESGKAKIIFGVGNKIDPYTEDDAIQLQLIANELLKIYKQREAEYSLRESEKKYRSLFENMLDGFVFCQMIVDEQNEPVDWVYLEINDAFERITGLKRETLVGKRVMEATPRIKSANPELFEIYRRVALTGKEERFEIFYKPLSLWLSVSVYCPMKGYVAAVLEDVTEHKKGDEELWKAKNDWERTFDSVPDFIAIVDNQYRIVRANRAMAQQLGVTPEQAVGLFCYRCVHGLESAPDFCPHAQTVKDEKEHTAEVHEPRLGGDFLVTTTPLRNANGNMIGSVHVARNITERKKAEEALKENEKRLNRSQEIAHLGSWELDLLTDKLTWSDEVYRIFGLKPQEFGATYEAFLQAVHSDDRKAVDDAYSGSLREGRDSYEIEHRVVRESTGEIRIVHEKCVHVRDETGKITRSIGMVQDITERRIMEAKLEAYSEHLENLVEERTRQLKDSERLAAIGATAGMVGHDIRNPLQAITGDVYLVKTELASLPDSDEKKNSLDSLQEIEKNIDYINKIVTDLQDFAKPLNPCVEEADLKLIITELLAKNNLPENVEVNVKVETEVRKVVSDPDYINRILYNLVTNAVQAMPKGGNLTIHAYKDNKANDVVLTVEDTGVGVPEKVKDKLFTPMFTTKSKGQGFGLAVVKRMTEALGGTVTFESRVGVGTTFTIKIPVKKQ
ncbi:MAG: PAS domain S-box protein [Candidatus Bathyarchaeia archaeon]|jgi:PAS domain S-box-containing protein